MLLLQQPGHVALRYALIEAKTGREKHPTDVEPW